MAFSSAFDSGLSSLDYASRYSRGPDLGAGDTTRVEDDSVRAANAMRADETIDSIEQARSTRAAAKDPSSAASFALGYADALRNLRSLAQSDPEKATEAYDRLEKGIARYRTQLVDMAGSQARDPLSTVLASSAGALLSYGHRSETVALEDGTEVKLGDMLGQNGRASTLMGARVRRLGVFDDGTIQAYTGDDEFRKNIAGVFVRPMLGLKNAALDPTRLQKADAAKYALAHADRLSAAFGEDGALRLLSGVQAMQGTAGGVTHLLDTFLSFGEKRAQEQGVDKYKLAQDVLRTYETLTTDMFVSDGRDRPITDDEKRFAALATMAAMESAGPFDPDRTEVRQALKTTAGLFARCNARGINLFQMLNDTDKDVKGNIAAYISALSTGAEPDGRLAEIARLESTLRSTIRGSSTSVRVAAEDTGDVGYYSQSQGRIRGQQSSAPLADAAAGAIETTMMKALIPRMAKGRRMVDALQDIQSSTDRDKLSAELTSNLAQTMALRGDAGAAAAKMLADRYISSLADSDQSGPFDIEQAVTNIVFAKEGDGSVPEDVKSTLRRWYRSSVVDERRYAAQTRQLMAHLMSKLGGGYTVQRAMQVVADTRSEADELASVGRDPSIAFDNKMRKGTYYVLEPGMVFDSETGEYRARKQGEQYLPGMANAAYRLAIDEDLPENLRHIRSQFDHQQQIAERVTRVQQNYIQAKLRAAGAQAGKQAAVMAGTGYQ